MALYAEMQERSLRPDSYTLTALLTACERVGDWRQALALFEDAVSAGVQPATINYNSLIFTLGKGDQWAQVLHIRGDCNLIWAIISLFASSSAQLGSSMADHLTIGRAEHLQ